MNKTKDKTSCIFEISVLKIFIRVFIAFLFPLELSSYLNDPSMELFIINLIVFEDSSLKISTLVSVLNIIVFSEKSLKK